MSKIPRTWILGLLGLTSIKNWLTSLSLLNVFLGKRFCCSHCYRAAKRNQQGTENHKYKLCSPACEPTCRSKTFLFKLKYLAREQRVSFLFRLQANQLLALLWVAVVTTQASVSVYTASQHGHTISHQSRYQVVLHVSAALILFCNSGFHVAALCFAHPTFHQHWSWVDNDWIFIFGWN